MEEEGVEDCWEGEDSGCYREGVCVRRDEWPGQVCPEASAACGKGPSFFPQQPRRQRHSAEHRKLHPTLFLRWTLSPSSLGNLAQGDWFLQEPYWAAKLSKSGCSSA